MSLPLSSAPTFRVIGGRGFQITFANGCTASVMFGPANYCERRSLMAGFQGNLESHDSPDAEVAAWDREGRMLIDPMSNGDEVVGHLSPDKVLAFMAAVAAHRGPGRLVFDFGRA